MQRTLPSSAYLSQETFERERERIFAREWFGAGREDALLAPGHFLKVDVAGESVLIVRTRSGELRGFYNVCRHRGSRIVMDDPEPSPGGSGATGRFKGSMVCPYHGWTGLAGELRLAPFLTESDGLRRAELSLHPVAVEEWVASSSCASCRMRPGPSAGRSRLGPVVGRTARYPLVELRTAPRITYEVAANWKCIVENFNECYHCGPVHPELCEVVPAFKRVGGAGLDWDRGIPHREGATTFTFTGTTDRAPFPGLSQDERTRHKGELIYPNLMLSMSPDHVTVFTLWPKGSRSDNDRLRLPVPPRGNGQAGFDP
ncbi:MAG: aromatic ring-hydroxylating oxygenase subunit alpha, partial [Actinomycetota bacterium]